MVGYLKHTILLNSPTICCQKFLCNKIEDTTNGGLLGKKRQKCFCNKLKKNNRLVNRKTRFFPNHQPFVVRSVFFKKFKNYNKLWVHWKTRLFSNSPTICRQICFCKTLKTTNCGLIGKHVFSNSPTTCCQMFLANSLKTTNGGLIGGKRSFPVHLPRGGTSFVANS